MGRAARNDGTVAAGLQCDWDGEDLGAGVDRSHESVVEHEVNVVVVVGSMVDDGEVGDVRVQQHIGFWM